MMNMHRVCIEVGNICLLEINFHMFYSLAIAKRANFLLTKNLIIWCQNICILDFLFLPTKKGKWNNPAVTKTVTITGATLEEPYSRADKQQIVFRWLQLWNLSLACQYV